MRQSQLFGNTLRENPRDEVSENAKLLERGGFVYKTMAGVYDYLPLGFRVLARVQAVIREEMEAIGGQEMFLSALQPRERWEKSGRWGVLGDIMYQFKDHSGREVGLASTHEEAMAEIATRSIFSYRDLPIAVFQMQTKFRDEPRAKSGIMRGREFLMKDLYSFHRDVGDLDRFYKIADKAYRKIFKRFCLEVYMAEASGGTFTKEYTHEYQVLSDAGEDWIWYCAVCRYAQNKEVSALTDGSKCPKCGGVVAGGKSIEVGNIFKLGTKFSEAFGLLYTDADGTKKPVVMGSYGIGLARVMGTIAEVNHDERGLVWPDAVAPFRAHLIVLLPKDASARGRIMKAADGLYAALVAKGIAVLYDDREEKTVGEKFADADLIGIPWRVVVSAHTLEKKSAELKKRSSVKAMLVPLARVPVKIK